MSKSKKTERKCKNSKIRYKGTNYVGSKGYKKKAFSLEVRLLACS